MVPSESGRLLWEIFREVDGKYEASRSPGPS